MPCSSVGRAPGRLPDLTFFMNSKYKGNITEFESIRTEDDGASFSFSCRSCNRKDGKVIHHQYTNEEIDYFVTVFNGKCYLIPVEECGGDKRLRILPTKNGQVRGITWAKDYELEEVVKNW